MRQPAASAAVALLTVALLASGCGQGGVRIARAAVVDGSQVVRPGVTSLKVGADDVGILAARAGVEEDVIRRVAPQLDEEAVWRQALTEVRSVYEQTPEELRENLVGVACEGFTGQISSPAALEQNIQQRVRVTTQDELVSLTAAVLQLWQQLFDARNSGDPDTQAAAVLTCFTVEQLAG